MKIYSNILDTVGNTPLVELINLEKKYNLKAKILAKVESFNPAGSVKDRIAKAMIEDAEKQGLINKDTVLIEPTSGNTGTGTLSGSRITNGYYVRISAQGNTSGTLSLIRTA